MVSLLAVDDPKTGSRGHFKYKNCYRVTDHLKNRLCRFFLMKNNVFPFSRQWLVYLMIPFIFFACSSQTDRKEKIKRYFDVNENLKVLSTTPMIGDLVREIGQEQVDCLNLIHGDLDPHSYELVKGDGEKIEGADLIFCNGLGLEHGASLRSSLKNCGAISLGDRVFEREPELFIKIDGCVDPHFWMDISLFAKIIDPIVQELSAKDRVHATLFAERGKALKRKLLSADQACFEKMQSLPSEKRFLVTSHDAFRYFTKKYLAEEGEKNWFKRAASPEGLAPDGQMSALDIQKVCDFLFSQRVCVVFPETNVNEDALKKIVSICREKGHYVKISTIPLYGDAMGAQGTGADTYLQMIEHNISTLYHYFSESDAG